MSYQYDLAGRRRRVEWPDGFFVLYTLNNAGEVMTIRENGVASGPGVLATYAYDDLGRRTSVTRGNGVTTNYSYDAASRLSELSQDLAGSSDDLTLNFSYNAAGQAISRTGMTGAYAWPQPSINAELYTANGRNQYATVGGQNFTYDSRGNLTATGAASYGYDAFNRLSSAGSATLSYDPAGRLYQVSASPNTTRFLYDGLDVIAEYDGSNTLQRRYVHGPSFDEPIVWYEGSGTTDRRWLLQDQLGSVVAATDGDGDLIGQPNTYDEYGRPGPNNTGRFQYTGQMWLAEAGVYHYKARAYAPNIGAFLQTDPILYAGGMNLYAYVGADPINVTDPLGLVNDAGGDIVVTIGCPRTANCFDDPYNASALGGARGANTLPRRFTEPIDPLIARRERIEVTEIQVTVPYSRTRDEWLEHEQGLEDATFDFFFFPSIRLGGFLGRLLCGCFEEGTLVATPDGLRRIEEIEIGDQVLAWNPETGETTTETVTALIRPEPRVLWRLEVRNVDGEAETFFVTDDHPWYVEGVGWVETRLLSAEQRIATADGRGLTTIGIAPTARVEHTYNLTVTGPHTFLVGENGAVVHNSLCNKLLHIFGLACCRFGGRHPKLTPPALRTQLG